MRWNISTTLKYKELNNAAMDSTTPLTWLQSLRRDFPAVRSNTNGVHSSHLDVIHRVWSEANHGSLELLGTWYIHLHANTAHGSTSVLYRVPCEGAVVVNDGRGHPGDTDCCSSYSPCSYIQWWTAWGYYRRVEEAKEHTHWMRQSVRDRSRKAGRGYTGNISNYQKHCIFLHVDSIKEYSPIHL